MHHAQAATDKEATADSNNINNRLLEKISAVNEIINSSSAGEPPYSFKLRYCDETVKQTRQIGYCTIAGSALILTRSMIRSASYQTAGLIFAFVAIFFAIYCMVYASKIEKTEIAEVSGDSIIVKGRTYSYSEISEISGVAFNGLKIMSNGTKVVSLNKACDGCGDLVRWAKLHNIPVNDSNTRDLQSIQKRNSVIVAVLVILALVIGFLMAFLKRM